MTTHFRGILKSVLGTLLLLCFALFLRAWWFGEGHGASLSTLAKIHAGMLRQEVIDLLGEPGTVNRRHDGSESWFYSRGTFCQVKVYLDGNGKVVETDHDH
jgi:outer membrane protein assembly factor BamE (lipoprotein component of BamABCDE complex)